MHWHKTLFIGALFLLAGAPSAFAQYHFGSSDHEFEITGFGGGKFGGTIDETNNIGTSPGPFDFLTIKTSWNYGGAFDYSIFPNFQAEFMFNRQPTVIGGHNMTTGQITSLTTSNLDMYQWGASYNFGDPERKFKPFVVGTVGFTHYGVSNGFPLGFSNRFSYTVGGGVKYFFVQHVGVRLEARYAPSHTTTGLAEFCDAFGECFESQQANKANQGMADLGIIVRFK